MMIRPMQPAEEAAVRTLCADIDGGACLADRPLAWHRDHPTLVAELDAQIVGYTSYILAHGTMLWIETCVAADYRGRGIGRALMTERLRIAEQLGMQIVAGGVKECNEVMVYLLESLGLHPCQRIPGGRGEPMIMYARHIHMEN